jgi:hypothetical protein
VVLDDVGSRALFALGERGQNRILPRAPESIAELQVILAFDLTDTDFSEIRLILRAKARNDLSLGVQSDGKLPSGCSRIPKPD